eukprot:COSAG02_NODE_4376_length_5437_cov_3.803484_3_plen_115_part_00
MNHWESVGKSPVYITSSRVSVGTAGGGGGGGDAVADGLPATRGDGPAPAPGGLLESAGAAPGGALREQPAGDGWEEGGAAEARDGDGGDDDGGHQGDRPGGVYLSLRMGRQLLR